MAADHAVEIDHRRAATGTAWTHSRAWTRMSGDFPARWPAQAGVRTGEDADG
ncbi:MAG: hypothetical protein WAM92_17665 [Mycobacterium sp.]